MIRPAIEPGSRTPCLDFSWNDFAEAASKPQLESYDMPPASGQLCEDSMQFCCTLILTLCCLPQQQDSTYERYTDDFVRGMARRDIDADIAAGNAKGFAGHPILDIVPAGESKSVQEIFAELNLDPQRIALLSSTQRHNVVFLEWALSPSYSLSIMTDARRYEAIEDQTDLSAIQGYGVRILAADR